MKIVMKRRCVTAAWMLILIAAHAAGGGQDEKVNVMSMPIVPFLMQYLQGRVYLSQTIHNHPDYTRIDAMMEDGPSPEYRLSMSEKEDSRIVYYTNSEAGARMLSASGNTVYVSRIEYKIEENLGEETKYKIAFKDRKGRLINWAFTTAGDPNEGKSGVALMSRPMELIYWSKAEMAGEGTAVRIDNTLCPAKELPELSTYPFYKSYSGTLCINAIIGGPVSGSLTWQLKSAPSRITPGAEWLFTDERNNSRRLKVTAKQGDAVTIREVDVNGPVKTPMTLEMQVKDKADSLSLSSLTFANDASILRLAFEPNLDLSAVARSGKKMDIAFQIDIGDRKRIVEGMIEVEQKGDSIELTGHPTYPPEAKSIVLKSRIALNRMGYTIEALNTASGALPRYSITEKSDK